MNRTKSMLHQMPGRNSMEGFCTDLITVGVVGEKLTAEFLYLFPLMAEKQTANNGKDNEQKG